MNTKQLMTRSVAFATALLLGAPLFAQPQTIIHWGGDHVSGSSNLNLLNAATADTGATRVWAPSIVTPTTNYSAPAGRIGPFSGTFQNTAAAASAFNALSVLNSGTADLINFRAGGSGDTNVKGLVYFVKSDFLNMSTSSIGLTGMTGTLNVNAQPSTTAEYRFAVLDSGNWYLSQTSTAVTGDFEISNFGTTNWGAWSVPSGPTPSPFAALPGSFTTAGEDLTNVQAVGFYFDSSRTGGQAQGSFASFQIIAIPEPGTLALLGIALGSLLLFRRKR